MTTLKLKSCDRCNNLADIRYRIQYQRQTDWILVCRNCWQSLSQDNLTTAMVEHGKLKKKLKSWQ